MKTCSGSFLMVSFSLLASFLLSCFDNYEMVLVSLYIQYYVYIYVCLYLVYSI